MDEPLCLAGVEDLLAPGAARDAVAELGLCCLLPEGHPGGHAYEAASGVADLMYYEAAPTPEAV